MAVPNKVRAMCRTLWRATGIPADTTLEPDGRYKIVLSSGRVVMTGYYKPMGRGEYQWSESTLCIDGVEVETADDAVHLSVIIDDPDHYLTHGVKKTNKVSQLLDVVPTDVDTAPSAVRHSYLQLKGNLPEAARLVAGMLGERWVLVMYVEDKLMYMTWECSSGLWQRSRDHLRVQVGDQMVTIPESDLERAMAMLMGDSSSPAAAATIGHPSAGARSNSVETRRATVIRN